MNSIQSMTLLACMALLCHVAPSMRAAEPEPAKSAPKFWKDSADQAEVLAATFLGGKGHEWLVAGGIQSDGTIVLAGNVAGPILDLPVPVAVLGTDLPPPDEYRRLPLMENGKQKTDSAGQPLWERLSWRHENVTGFVVRCSADLTKILSAHRLPWTSGAISAAAVDDSGFLYIAGRATENLGALGADVQELPAAETQRKEGGCQHVFVAKLTPAADKVLWVRHRKGFSDAPQLALTAEGLIRFAAQDVSLLDASGHFLRDFKIPGGARPVVSLAPDEKHFVVGGEHHWKTGREPWRCPTLNVYQPDGALEHQLYDWGGPYVGLDNCRLVSDSAVRWVTHDRGGNILIYAWSDGGNSVMTRQPADIRSGVDVPGLGINAAGAGVLSCAYLVRIEPIAYRAVGWTIWLAFSQKGRPNSVWIDTLAAASDGSVCFGGRSAWGLWQTSNRLTDGEPAGEYVAVLSNDLSLVRYCSVVPGAGVAEVGDGSQKLGSSWGIISGAVQGKPRVLFVGGAVREAEVYERVTATPTKNGLQPEFGGGESDGYAILLDLSTRGELSTAPLAKTPSALLGPTSASFEQGTSPPNLKHSPVTPADGTEFHFLENYPTWVSVDAEFRDRAGQRWPNFLYGKPVSGSFIFHATQPQCRLTLSCNAVCQPRGDQSAKVLSDLLENENTPPEFKFSLESLGPAKSEEIQFIERGQHKTKTVEYHEGRGTLQLGARVLTVTPRVTRSFQGPRGGVADALHLTAWLTLKAGELGLDSLPSENEIDLRFGMVGTLRTEPPHKAK